jgi:hypothetical protein
LTDPRRSPLEDESIGSGHRPGLQGRFERLPWVGRFLVRILIGFALVGAGIALMQVSRVPGIVLVFIGLVSIPILYPRDRR